MKQFQVDLPLIPPLYRNIESGAAGGKLKEIHVGKSEIMKESEASPRSYKPGTYFGSQDETNYT